jgi:hypothetical protein
MRSLGRTSALVLAACAVLASGPALARTVTVSDPAGDGLQGHRLDITGLKVANRDHAIVTTVSVVRVVHGDVAVYIQARGDRRSAGVVVASFHRARGDKNELLTSQGAQKCAGLGATWSDVTDRVQLRLPSGCFDHGNYGAVEVKVITETNGGEDADFAPNGPKGRWRWTDWISRG